MLNALKEFRVGRPQVFAGLMLLTFLAQCLWTAHERKISELEYHYMLAGLSGSAGTSAPTQVGAESPMTSLMAALPLKATNLVRKFAPASWNESLAVPHTWL